MLYRYSEVFRTILLVSDLILVAASWVASYWLRFHAGFAAPKGIPSFGLYCEALLVILPLWFVLFRLRGLYAPRRMNTIWGELGRVLYANAVGVILFVALAFFLQSYAYSRPGIVFFFVLVTVSIGGFRIFLRMSLRHFRERGFNQRYLVVVGAGELAQAVIDRIHGHPEIGLQILGLFSDDSSARGETVNGVPVIGAYAEVKAFVQNSAHRVDQVIMAVPHEDADAVAQVVSALDDEMVTVRLVPDLMGMLTLRSSVEDLDGLPMLNLRDGRLIGLSAVQKRIFDVGVSFFLLLLLSPAFLLISLGVLLTSGRPILYSQERMGLDGRVFSMLKFRTMVVDAEHASGPVWTAEEDSRRTGFGGFLRSMSLDELPQLWNVLRGDMSLVGPRPERPVFIDQFRHEIPGYMLRHSVKAGLTGWAQVHGWRGNTSVHERIEHDIYYIQNWSFKLDLWILWKTVFRGVVNPNAY